MIIEKLNSLNIQGDDAGFVDFSYDVLENTVRSVSPEFVYVIRVDNWFGPRWLGFEGKNMGAFGSSRSRAPFVVPPFNPNRVSNQAVYQRSELKYEQYDLIKAKPLHYRMSSSNNLNRKIRDISSSAIYFWFSSNSQSTERGSLMVYVVEKTNESIKYVGMKKKNDDWIVVEEHGTSDILLPST